jgi:hypothetical protein
MSLYYPFLDLLKSENRLYAQYLLPRVVEQITNDQIVTIHQTYQIDIGLSLDDFRREVERWRHGEEDIVHTNGFRISEGPETDSIATCASNVYACRPDG